MSRTLIYQHYNKCNRVDKHIYYQLGKVCPSYDRIILVSNSDINEVDKGMLMVLVDEVIVRANKGYDFGAWKEVLAEKIIDTDWLYLMNSTCFGPIEGDNFNTFETYLNVMEEGWGRHQEVLCDFWGWTNHKETIQKNDHKLWFEPKHIQTYFMGFRKEVYKSNTWSSFWSKVENKKTQDEVIIQYETRFTDALEAGGFKSDVYVDCSKVQYKRHNVAFFYPLMTLLSGMPFVKIKSFLLAEEPLLIRDAMKVYGYDTTMVDNYFKNNHGWNVC